MAIEACGGGTSDLGYFLELSLFIGIFGVGLTSRRFPSRPRGRPTRLGGHPPPSWMARDSSGPTLARQLDPVWYSFSVELKNKEKTETGTGLWVNRLVPKII